MGDLEGEGFSEEVVKIKTPYGYWIPTLWLVSLVLVGTGGYAAAGAGTSPKFLAAIGEAWSNMFTGGQEEFVEVIDTRQLAPPATLLGEPDRVFTRGVDNPAYPVDNPTYPAEADVVASREFCNFDAGNRPARNMAVISEVAWMGGLESEDLGPGDEWMEVRSRSPEAIDIGGWQLVDSGEQIQIVFPAGFILNPGGYYLLERTDDYSVPAAVADLIYAGNLSNSDEGLRLFNAQCGLEDEVLADSDWPAGDAPSRRTMERSSDLNWHTYSGPITDGILGTPKRGNSESVIEVVEENIEEELAAREDDFSLCSQDSLSKPTHEVWINEVAWSGKSENTSEEWMELYNPASKPVDLFGWQLVDRENSIVVGFNEGDEIDEYFLLRRILSIDDPSEEYLVGNKPADKTYTGVIQNNDESLRLFNSECALVDEVDGVGDNWSNMGGTASPDYRSAERTDENDWHTYSGSERNGIMGTPRADNSAPSSNSQNTSTGGGGGSSGGTSSASDEINYCPQDDLNSPTRIVYINEVAWAGTASSTSEEWLELYTPVGGGLSLRDWQLLDRDGEIQIVFGESSRIDDYLLLRRILTTQDPTAEYSVGGSIADILYEGVLQNDEETLRLFDASCNLVDEIVDAGQGWVNIGGSASPDYRTAERIAGGSWKSYEGDGESGVMGTPRAENSSVASEEGDDEGDGETGDETEDDTEDEDGEEDGGEDTEGGDEGDEITLTDLEITEIVYDIKGADDVEVADDGQERVKIFNSGDGGIIIETFSIQYLKVGKEFSAIERKNFESGNAVSAGGNFIVGMSCHPGASPPTPCEEVDMSWSQALANDGGTVYLVSNQEDVTGSDDLDIVHFLAYAPVIPSAGG